MSELRLDDEFGEPIPDSWEKLGTPPPGSRIWWCSPARHLEAHEVPGAGWPHWTMPAFCYWSGTVDHFADCGWVSVIPLPDKETP